MQDNLNLETALNYIEEHSVPLNYIPELYLFVESNELTLKEVE